MTIDASAFVRPNADREAYVTGGESCRPRPAGGVRFRRAAVCALTYDGTRGRRGHAAGMIRTMPGPRRRAECPNE